jgi:hypothetical protein
MGLCVLICRFVFNNYVNVIPSQGIQMFSLASHCYNVYAQCSVYGLNIQVITVASDVMNMFFLHDVKCSTHLPDVFQWTF